MSHEPEEADAAAAPPTHVGGLGDLMAADHSFWGVCADDISQFSPLERVLIAANGNLQRLVSSYLNSDVSVAVSYNRRVEHGKYEREVTLSVRSQQFAVATSTVTLTREDCIDAVERRGVAIGQMFRHLNIMPRFRLHGVGEQADARFWREYTLEADGCCCRIREVIMESVFDLPEPEVQPPASQQPSLSPAAPAPAPLPARVGTFGDIMSVNSTGMSLPDGFTGLQRLLLTANGNVERIVRAFYDEEVHSHLIENARVETGVYERKVSMHVRGSQFMTARSTVYITSDEWRDAAEKQRVPVGELFGHFGQLPTFTLHSAGRSHGEYFWRVYSLRSSGMSCEITETFAADVLDRLATRRPAKRKATGHGF